MKSQQRVVQIDYPEETEGSKLAREGRIIFNKLSKSDRKKYENIALQFIKKIAAARQAQ